MTQDELIALVALEQRQSLGYTSSKLSAARQKAEYYYLGLPVGDLSPSEIDGRSSVVSTDVRDTIEHPEWLKSSGLDEGVTQYDLTRHSRLV